MVIVLVLAPVTVEIIPHGQSSKLLTFNNENLIFLIKKNKVTSQTAHPEKYHKNLFFMMPPHIN